MKNKKTQKNEMRIFLPLPHQLFPISAKSEIKLFRFIYWIHRFEFYNFYIL